MSTIFGLMRVKNEAQWIQEVVESILPVCERVFILDDNSEDWTRDLLQNWNERITLIRSPFKGLDEARDKEFLLDRVMNCVSDYHLSGDEASPFWALAIDGDEVLAPGGADVIRKTIAYTDTHAFKLPIIYLWNDRQHRRVDGVYRHFARPSLFRLMNRNFRFQRTPWAGNFHCSSIPQELLHHAHAVCPAPLLHLGYMAKRDRWRKYLWYTTTDPDNSVEDNYRHIVQGDTPEIPADAQLLHAGPLTLEAY